MAITIVMNEFRAWCGLLNVHGAINGMHISIVKSSSRPKNYYYHKISGYNVMAQVVVDCKKMFINFFVNLLRSVNYLGCCIGVYFIKMPNDMVCLSLTQILNMGFHLTFWKINVIH